MPSGPSIYLKKAERTPSSGRPAMPGLSGLPDDLLQDGVRRLGLACIIYAATYFCAYFGPMFFYMAIVGDYPINERWLPFVAAIVSIFLALVLFVLTRIFKHKPVLLLDLGLIFMVVSTFGISMNTTYGIFPEWSIELLEKVGFNGIPWECNWIIIFPMLAPNSPGKVLLAALASASMPPLAVLISKSTGATSADAPWLFFVSYFLFTTYLCAFIAFFMSRIVIRFGARLKKAREIGQYQMIERLGEGGMGEVWLARHRMLARPAAVKLIRSEAFGGDEASRIALLRRFEREARATAALRSVHTISVFDFGITDEGFFYYVMELLDGLDQESFVKRFGPVAPGRVIHWLRQACHSLADAHEHGMIHRDIKPANLYVCRLGPDYDFIKVLDFGLVKTGGDHGQDAVQLTQEGASFGTPGYMPPEMAMGKGKVDARADIYSLGCVAYWLLTGQPVFEGDTPLSVVLDHVKTEPVPPSERSEIAVPEDLERIVLACLAKEPADRPQTALELAEQLGTCASAGAWTRLEMKEWWEMHLPSRRDPHEDEGTIEGALQPETNHL